MQAVKDDAIGEGVKTQRDHGFLAIVALVVVIAVWLLLMPWVKPIIHATMNRFHLRSASFAIFAIQFPIPAMYNFANRSDVQDYPPDLVDPLMINLDPKLSGRYCNHFPARTMTFADARFFHLQDGKDRWFTIESTYRGERLTSRFHLKPDSEQGYLMLRLDEP
ncbi:hypothetical protein Pla22_08290 [Rubripirellula amarantea]|uniref:Uncharacterized protein n=1 Tax=Rubripirellula amarantea TaxID=2527999 RepID=A0A5C5WSS0_9BACT|nr:hypothetical protein [Rubripirellula amarantea]TWT53201.1 hypothetical protein Pla22_08290 [Rubripirellula amarantea]